MSLPEYLGGDVDYLTTLQTALAEQWMVDICYRDKNGLASQRQVEPIGLAFYNLAWHLMAGAI